MFIKTLTLNQFRGLEKSYTFKFEKGVNLLYGENGSSKTSATIAISLLLFDKSPFKLEEMVNENKDSFFIESVFNHEGKTYKTNLAYNLKNKESKRELYINDMTTPEMNTTSAVKEFFVNLWDSTLVYNAMFLAENTQNLLNQKPVERLELFKKIRNIDYSKKVKEIDEDVKVLEDKNLSELDMDIKVLENKDYTYMEENDLPYTEEQISTFQKEIETRQFEKNSLVSKKELNSRVVSQVLSTKSQIADINKEIVVLRDDLFAWENKVLEDKITPVKSDLDIAVSTKQLKEEVGVNTKTINNTFLAKKQNLEEQKISISEELSSITVGRSKKKDFSQIQTLQVELKELKNKLDNTKADICPTCGRPMEGHDPEKLEQEKAIFVKSIEDKTKKLSSLQLEKEQYDKIQEAKQEKINKKSSLELQLATILANITSIEEDKAEAIKQAETLYELELKTLNNNIENYKKMISVYEEEKIKFFEDRESNVEKLITSIASKDFKLSSLHDELEKLEKEIVFVDENRINEINIEMINFQNMIVEYNNVVAGNEKAVEYNDSIDEQKEKDTKDLESLKAKKDDLLKTIDYHKKAKKILQKDFPNFIIQETITGVEKRMNDFINGVYYKALDVQLRSTSTSLKMEYGLVRKRDCSNLSGAESIITSLSFLYALNQEVGLNFVSLDEIDAPLTEENVITLYDAIMNMPFEQSIFITHNKYTINKMLEESVNAFEFKPNFVQRIGG